MARPFAKAFYRSKAWAQARALRLKMDCYLCVKCGEPAEEVHHKIHLTPGNIGVYAIALAPDNLMSLCTDCHFKEHAERVATGEEYAFDENGMLARIPPPKNLAGGGLQGTVDGPSLCPEPGFTCTYTPAHKIARKEG